MLLCDWFGQQHVLVDPNRSQVLLCSNILYDLNNRIESLREKKANKHFIHSSPLCFLLWFMARTTKLSV
jgi:hypothetical protein